jgi:hypothetical protein
MSSSFPSTTTQDTSSRSSPDQYAPPSLDHLSIWAYIALAFVLFLGTGILVYAIYSCFHSVRNNDVTIGAGHIANEKISGPFKQSHCRFMRQNCGSQVCGLHFYFPSHILLIILYFLTAANYDCRGQNVLPLMRRITIRFPIAHQATPRSRRLPHPSHPPFYHPPINWASLPNQITNSIWFQQHPFRLSAQSDVNGCDRHVDEPKALTRPRIDHPTTKSSWSSKVFLSFLVRGWKQFV